MIGDEYLEKFDVLFHNAENEEELEYIGETDSGNSVYLNTHYVQAAFRIVTGYVEPHFFSGYSGGRKAILPGIAGKETIIQNHSAKKIHSSNARFGIASNNPIHEEMEEATRMSKPEFCINAILNKDHEITHIAAGNIFAVFNHLVQIQEKTCFTQIKDQYDIVICTNGGYPLDQNLYQAVKSMAIGEMASKKNGIIISINECRDGVGQDGFNSLINSGQTPIEIYNDALEGTITMHGIWQIQIMARVLRNHSVYVVSSLEEKALGNVGLKFGKTVEEAIFKGIDELKKPIDEISVLLLPDGPLLLPVLR
jgi:nickel-dependent lactate racemase